MSIGLVACGAAVYGIAGWRKAAREGRNLWGRLASMSWRIGGVFAVLAGLMSAGVVNLPL